MNTNLTGKTALVCGGSQGIGLAAAKALAELGAAVTLVANNADLLVQAQKSLPTPQGQQHGHVVADFTQPEQMRSAVHQWAARQPHVHLLVNNTGGPPGGPILEAAVPDFLHAYQMHLVCNHILAQTLVPHMKQAGYGRIVNVISTSVKIPLRNLGVSNTTRGAVASWAKTLANELGPFGITVNNVLPGFTRTQRLTQLLTATAQKTGKPEQEIEAEWIREVPLGRLADAQEVGDVIAFLCTPAASYITGINVPVDGGRTGSL